MKAGRAGRVNIMQLFDKRSSVVLDLALSLFFLTISTLLGTLFYRLDFSDSTIMITTFLSIRVSPCRFWSRAIPWFFWLCS